VRSVGVGGRRQWRGTGGVGQCGFAAASVVDFALAAIDEAEYAVLDAILAWADAEARAAHS
jgi:hypothetical protein